VQGVITATMCADATRIPQLIRGHFGSIVMPNGERFGEYEFVAERPQVTLNSKNKSKEFKGEAPSDTVAAHMQNFFDAVIAGKPEMVNNTPELGAATTVTMLMSRNSYRDGKVYFFDAEKRKVVEGDASWAKQWEAMSKAQAAARHVPGWHAGDYGSTVKAPEFMKLAGPWIDGKPPEPRS
jgi:hypothetical protein